MKKIFQQISGASLGAISVKTMFQIVNCENGAISVKTMFRSEANPQLGSGTSFGAFWCIFCNCFQNGGKKIFFGQNLKAYILFETFSRNEATPKRLVRFWYIVSCVLKIVILLLKNTQTGTFVHGFGQYLRIGATQQPLVRFLNIC